MPLTWPRTTLISKLEKYRFEGGTHRCIRNWLHGHSQRVVINSSVFRKRPATSEVTQRSVLGPVLFSTFLNNMALDASSLQAVMARLDKALSSPIYWLATLSTTKGWNRMLFEVPSNLSYLLFYLLSMFTFIYSYKKLQASKTHVAYYEILLCLQGIFKDIHQIHAKKYANTMANKRDKLHFTGSVSLTLQFTFNCKTWCLVNSMQIQFLFLFF